MGSALDISIDSTGIGIHNGNQRRPTKNKNWRKFHAAVDGYGNIVAAELSNNKAADSSKVKKLVSKIEKPLSSAMADSAYDTNTVYKTLSPRLKNKNSRIIIPPKKNAKVSASSHKERNRNIRSCKRQGRREWIKSKSYNQRNRVENTFFRFKHIFGQSFTARTLQGQRVEMQLRCKLLNSMTKLGMPQSSLRI